MGMGMGIFPLLVFLVIVVGGILILNRVNPKPRQSNQTDKQKKNTSLETDDRIHTSWGYSFPADYVFEPDVVRSREQLLTDFKKLLTRNFGDYRIYYQVPASELDGSAHPASVPVPFIFEKDGNYLLAVFIVSKNTYRGMNVLATEQICRDFGMQCIRFYEEYANDDEYVVSRIRHFLS